MRRETPQPLSADASFEAWQQWAASHASVEQFPASTVGQFDPAPRPESIAQRPLPLHPDETPIYFDLRCKVDFAMWDREIGDVSP